MSYFNYVNKKAIFLSEKYQNTRRTTKWIGKQSFADEEAIFWSEPNSKCHRNRGTTKFLENSSWHFYS